MLSRIPTSRVVLIRWVRVPVEVAVERFASAAADAGFSVERTDLGSFVIAGDSASPGDVTAELVLEPTTHGTTLRARVRRADAGPLLSWRGLFVTMLASIALMAVDLPPWIALVGAAGFAFLAGVRRRAEQAEFDALNRFIRVTASEIAELQVSGLAREGVDEGRARSRARRRLRAS